MEKAMLINYGNTTVFSTPVILSGGKCTLGRGLQNNHIFEDMSISRIHCSIEESGKEWVIIDKSSNGTFVNGNLIGRLKAHVLQHNDVIAIGDRIKFQFIKTYQKSASNTNSDLSEEDILNIADAMLAEKETPLLSQSLAEEFSSPMFAESSTTGETKNFEKNQKNITCDTLTLGNTFRNNKETSGNSLQIHQSDVNLPIMPNNNVPTTSNFLISKQPSLDPQQINPNITHNSKYQLQNDLINKIQYMQENICAITQSLQTLKQNNPQNSSVFGLNSVPINPQAGQTFLHSPRLPSHIIQHNNISDSLNLHPASTSTTTDVFTLYLPKPVQSQVHTNHNTNANKPLVLNFTPNVPKPSAISLNHPMLVRNNLPGTPQSSQSIWRPYGQTYVIAQRDNQSAKKAKLQLQTSTSPPSEMACKTYSKKKIKTEDAFPGCSEMSSVEVETKEDISSGKNMKEIKKEEPQPSCSKPADSNCNIEAAEDELQCSICTEMFIKAVTLSCSHTFCKFCIDEWKKKKTVCPICRARIRSTFPTIVIDNFIQKILEDADEDTKLRRAKLIAERESQTVSTSKPSQKRSRTTMAQNIPYLTDTIVLSSESEAETNEVTDSFESDFEDDIDDFGYVPYNGLPGRYYGGYGYCYKCGDRGHWARGCPN